MIYMLCRECVPSEFYRYICQDDNFKYLNGRDVSQQGVLEIVVKFIDQNKENASKIPRTLQRYLSVRIFARVSRDLLDQQKTWNRLEKQLPHHV